jgi:flagellar basal-body rod modification protein FlgD
MTISSVTAAAGTDQAASQTKPKDTLSREDFITLLVTQMRFQDPLNPIDNNQMATQMAQFSSLQALQDMSDSLETMAAYQSSSSNLQVAGLIGKTVEAAGNSLLINQGSVSEGHYQLSRPGMVRVGIYDSGGQLVRTLDEGVKDTSKQKIIWDGKNQEGVSLPDGAYTFQIAALDEKGQSVSVSSSMVAPVTGVSFDNGITYLQLGSAKITVSDILSIL